LPDEVKHVNNHAYNVAYACLLENMHVKPTAYMLMSITPEVRSDQGDKGRGNLGESFELDNLSKYKLDSKRLWIRWGFFLKKNSIEYLVIQPFSEELLRIAQIKFIITKDALTKLPPTKRPVNIFPQTKCPLNISPQVTFCPSDIWTFMGWIVRPLFTSSFLP
jgi:hypothetical protein